MSTVFERFREFSDKERLRIEYHSLCADKINALLACRITYGDPAAEYGRPFSDAVCHSQPDLGEVFPFGSIFDDGVKVLNEMLKNHIPEDNPTKVIGSTLLQYLFDENSHTQLVSIKDDVQNETHLMTTLAMHLFCKLSVSKGCTMDKYAPNKDKICRCGDCKTEDIMSMFGDTSIGNVDVWHGSMDMFLDSSDVCIHVTLEEVNENSSDGRTPVEANTENLDSVKVRDQALARTIVFSFLQKQRNPAMRQFLVPCILASQESVKFFFYDSVNDILLESRKFPFVLKAGKSFINYEAIIGIWLVLNYKLLCSGPTDMILAAPKADFSRWVGPKIAIYRSELRLQNVYEGGKKRKRTFEFEWDVLKSLPEVRFVWPESSEKPLPVTDSDPE